MNRRILFLSTLLSATAGLLLAAELGGEITDPEQVLTGIPRDVFQDLRLGSRQIEDAAAKATAQVRKNTENKVATLKLTVREVEKYQRKEAPDVTRLRVRAVPDRVRESGATLDVMISAVTDVSENSKMAKIDKGSKITITGKINNAEILARKAVELRIDLMDAKLK